MASGQVSPSQAMQNQLTTIDGEIHPVTLLGRWIARAQGVDDAELKREGKQRKLQEKRANLYAERHRRTGPGRPRPRVRGRRPRRRRAARLPPALRALGAPELDGHRARLHGRQGAVGDHAGARRRSHTIWSLGSFYVGEERVTADLAPFLLAAPTGEIEAVPRHPAGRRGAPRRLLRPLRRRGDVPRGGRLPRPHAGGRGDPARPWREALRRRAARRLASASRRSPTTSSCSSRA